MIKWWRQVQFDRQVYRIGLVEAILLRHELRQLIKTYDRMNEGPT